VGELFPELEHEAELTNWRKQAEWPQDDSTWPVATKTTTNSRTTPATLPVLFADDYDFRTGPSEYTAGQKVLLPIALVGNWNPRDLPHEIRQADGSVYESVPYHAKKVLTMSGAWRPSAGCVFESPSFKGNPRFQEDPSTMEPLDLTMRKAGS